MRKTGWGETIRWVLTGAVVAAASLGSAASGSAQEPGQERVRERTYVGPTECRCVDESGAELEDCVCIRTPRMERMVVAPWGQPGPRPRLGLSVELGDPVDGARGARVAGVLEGGPADRAGLLEGDVVTRLNGHALAEPLDAARERELDASRDLPAQRLLALVRDIEPGDRVVVEYLRDGRTQTTTLDAEALGREFAFAVPGWDEERLRERMQDLEERMRDFRGPDGRRMRVLIPGAPDAPGEPPRSFRFRFEEPEGEARARPQSVRGPALGLEMSALNPELGAYFGAERGVLVTAVDEERALGLRAGDVILAVDGVPTERPLDVLALLRERGTDGPVTFRVRREGREIDVSGRLRP